MCSYNEIEILPVFPRELEFFECNYNKIKWFHSFPPNVYHIDCSNNLLETFPEITQRNIHLNCDHNPITEIIDKNPNRYNHLRYIDIRKNINILYRFRQLFYLLKIKFSKKLKNLLWERIRKPKIMALYSPENIQNTILKIQEYGEMDVVNEEDFVERLVLSIENKI